MNNFGQGAGALSSVAFPELFSGFDKSHLDLFFQVRLPNASQFK